MLGREAAGEDAQTSLGSRREDSDWPAVRTSRAQIQNYNDALVHPVNIHSGPVPEGGLAMSVQT